MLPHFIIKNNFQKRSLHYRDILTDEILSDVCQRITGKKNFTVTFDNEVNIGRLATLEYKGCINYVSFSEIDFGGRNSSLQSFPSALIRFYQSKNSNKNLYFYFLEHKGNNETDYLIFMYRLMKTVGTNFLNEEDFLSVKITPFNSVSDIIVQRNLTRDSNKANNSSYVTIDDNGMLQIFGKLYGANKYESTLLCIALQSISPYPMEFYEIKEGNLEKLPKPAREVIVSLGVTVITSDFKLEKKEFESNDSLRSPSYIYNLLNKLGDKKCSLCDCEIPQIIQGAHIWQVASIKKTNNIDLTKKIQHATDGENGLWLCNNHHKLFDINWLYISTDGSLKYRTSIKKTEKKYLKNFTKNKKIPNTILTTKFIEFLGKRNALLDEGQYIYI